MITIIKRGKAKDQPNYFRRCHECCTEFEFNQKDCRREYDQSGDGYYLVVNCPICHTPLIQEP